MNKFDDDLLAEAMSLDGFPDMSKEGEEDGTNIIRHSELVLKDIDSDIDNLPDDFKTDYELVRQSYHYQQQMLLDASQIALQNAKDNDAPRAMEVFSTIMNSWAALNKELLKMHTEIKAITKKESIVPTGEVNTQNNIIMAGTPADVLAALGSQFDQQKDVIDAKYEETKKSE